jgi:quinol monooxygenase YgiN
MKQGEIFVIDAERESWSSGLPSDIMRLSQCQETEAPMYTATMLYHFKDEAFDSACEIWRSQVIEHAKAQPGFVRMQLLVARPKALAVGTWKDNTHARTFMETGVFKRLMAQLQGSISQQPEQSIWDLKYFEEK